jgi:hypothetical protein
MDSLVKLCAMPSLQAVAEGVVDESDLALIASMEEQEEGGISVEQPAPAPDAAPGKRRSHRRHRKKTSPISDPLADMPEAEEAAVPAGSSLATGGASPAELRSVRTTASMDLEGVMGPYPPPVSKKMSGGIGSSRAGSSAGYTPPTPSPGLGLVPAPESPVLPIPASSLSAFAAAAIEGFHATPTRAAMQVAPPAASWVVRGVFLTHKYTDPTHVDITITNAGARPSC